MHIDSLLQENIQNINFARRIWGNQYRKHFKSLLAYDLLEKTVGQQSADRFFGGSCSSLFLKVSFTTRQESNDSVFNNLCYNLIKC